AARRRGPQDVHRLDALRPRRRSGGDRRARLDHGERGGLLMTSWWQEDVVYQVYIRSFADADGDGVGDLPGITSRLPYLRDLGVDAVWLSAFYVSPMNDAGYDVADYRDIDPRFGSLDDADTMVATAHELGLKVLVDLVPHHTS